MAYGIFLDQGLNKYTLCRQADSSVPSGSPKVVTFKLKGAGYSPFKALGKKSVPFLDFILDFIAVQFAVLHLIAQLCLTLCDTMDCSPPGSFLHGILQARILEWVTIPFSRGSSQLRDRTWVSCTAGIFFTV